MASPQPPLSDLLPLAQAKANDPAACGFELSRSIVLAVRESRAVRPDLVAKFGCYLLHSHTNRLGAEVWSMYEQVYTALLMYGKRSGKRGGDDDSEDMRLAQEYCALLSHQFPDSMRVKRLEGMMWEAKGEHDMATKDYDDILEADPNALQAMKRQVALLRARGRPVEAAKKLVEHLGVVCSDTESWLALCDLYLQQQQYAKAKARTLQLEPRADSRAHTRLAAACRRRCCAPPSPPRFQLTEGRSPHPRAVLHGGAAAAQPDGVHVPRALRRDPVHSIA